MLYTVKTFDISDIDNRIYLHLDENAQNSPNQLEYVKIQTNFCIYVFLVQRIGRCKSDEVYMSKRQMLFFGTNVDFLLDIAPNDSVPIELSEDTYFEISNKFHSLIKTGNNIIQSIRNELQNIPLIPNMEYIIKGYNTTIKYTSNSNSNRVIGNSNILFRVVETNKVENIVDSMEMIKMIFGEIPKSQTKYQNESFSLKNINLSMLKVGGLSKQLTDIFKRAILPRFLPIDMFKNLGLKHEKGMILYGKSGCGKTLVAREIAKIMSHIPPIIADAPSLFDKHVGTTEANIRELFKPAKQDNDPNNLHIIIIDEIDALCRKRGSFDNSGVRDIAVNQFLCSLDGVEIINNVFVIGMTNHKHLLDEAVIRPGRMGIHICIDLPDKIGRVEILNIYTKSLVDSKYLSDDVDINKLADMTEYYTGAEIESLVNRTISEYLLSKIDINNLNNDIFLNFKPIISMCDFTKIIAETLPMYKSNTLFDMRIFIVFLFVSYLIIKFIK